MRNFKFSAVVVALAVLVILVGIALNFVGKGPRQLSGPPAAVNEIVERRQLSTSVQPSAREIQTGEEDTSPSDDWSAKILALKLPREKIEQYLTRHHRDAASLIAAFHASGDTNNLVGDINFLKEAATNFPNDPHVQWTVLAQWSALENAGFSDSRRKWLDAFKTSSPSNSLANYLSAREYFDKGQTEAAVNEMLAATGKPQFGNYAQETLLGEEELYRSSGKTPMDVHIAARGAMAGDMLAPLAGFKGLANAMTDLQKQYLDAGDGSSAQNLAEMGMVLANRLDSGESGKLLISQLVGMAIEAISLQHLDQNTSYDFLGGKSPKERSDELKQQRQLMRDLTKDNEALLSRMTDAELLNYFDRQQIYGELEAARWLHQRYGTNGP